MNYIHLIHIICGRFRIGKNFIKFVRILLQSRFGSSIKIIHTLYYRRLSGAPKRSPDLFFCGFHAFLI
jgi:hypothetical protein